MQKKLLSLLSKFSGNIAVGKCLFAWQLHKRNSPWKLYNQMSGARAYDTAKGMSCKTVLMQSQCAMCNVHGAACLFVQFFFLYLHLRWESFFWFSVGFHHTPIFFNALHQSNERHSQLSIAAIGKETGSFEIILLKKQQEVEFCT